MEDWGLTHALIQYEIKPVYVIIPVCLSLSMAKEVSKLVLKHQKNQSKKNNFVLTPFAEASQLQRPRSLDGVWYRAGGAGSAAKSK